MGISIMQYSDNETFDIKYKRIFLCLRIVDVLKNSVFFSFSRNQIQKI